MKKSILLFLSSMGILITSTAYPNSGFKFYLAVKNDIPASQLSVTAVSQDPEINCIFPPTPKEVNVAYAETSVPILNITNVSYDYCKPHTIKNVLYYFRVVKNDNTILEGHWRCNYRELPFMLGCEKKEGNAIVKSTTKGNQIAISLEPEKSAHRAAE